MGEYTSFIEKIKGTDFRGTNFIEYNDLGGEIYISLQVLLYFLEEYVNLGSKGKSIIKIDWENDKPFYAFSTSISTNLRKCYLYNDYLKTTDGSITEKGVATFHPFTTFKNDDFKKLNTDLQTKANNPEKYSIYPQVGNINYIYLNIGYLSTIINKENPSQDNDISIKNFLQTICNDVNKSLGGINDFQVTSDPDEGFITIIDFNQKRIKGLAQSEDKLITLKLQGLGSFVTSISAQSSITPEIASTISIGAQANGNQIGKEATSFSRLSEGLKDRIYPEKKINNNPKVEISQTKNNSFESSVSAYKKLIALQQETPDSKTKISITSDDKSNVENVPTDLYKALLGAFTETNQSSTSFIPIKLDLTLAGISGIKIFQRFNVSSDILPYTYKDNYNFITTGVSHEVNNNNQWLTKISSLIALKEQDVKISSAFHLYIGTLPTPSSEEVLTTSNGDYEAFTPGQVTKIPTGIPGSQMQKAITKTGQTIDTIIAQQNSFPTTISGYGVTSGLFRNSNGDYHGGFDLSTPIGTQITLKEDVIFRGNRKDPNGYGDYVLIEYQGKGIVFGHLSEQYKGNIKIGETIKAGTLIGKTGNSGKSSGPHLHFHVYNSISLGDKHVLPLEYALKLLTLKA
jgi:murein DD-endopeptidase MepM/ murein hydrolase activator NlpD